MADPSTKGAPVDLGNKYYPFIQRYDNSSRATGDEKEAFTGVEYQLIDIFFECLDRHLQDAFDQRAFGVWSGRDVVHKNRPADIRIADMLPMRFAGH